MFSLLSYTPRISSFFSTQLIPKTIIPSLLLPTSKIAQNTLSHSSKQQAEHNKALIRPRLLKKSIPQVPDFLANSFPKQLNRRWIYLSIQDHEVVHFLHISKRYIDSIQKLRLNFIVNIEPSLEFPKTSNLLYMTSQFFQNSLQREILSKTKIERQTKLPLLLLRPKIEEHPEPLIKSLEPVIQAGKTMAKYLKNNFRATLGMCGGQIDEMLENSSSPYFHALKGHPDITVCTCQNCRQSYEKQTNSPFGSTDRLEFTAALLKKIERLFPDTKKPLKIASLGAGGTFHEMILHSSLVALGYTCEWTIVDSYYSEYSGKKSAAEFQKLAKNLAHKTQVTISNERPEEFVDTTKEKYDILLMIHNDNAISENETRKKWRAICKETHIRANLRLQFDRTRKNRYLLGSQGQEVKPPKRPLDAKDSEQLLEDFFRFYIGIHSEFDTQAEKGLLNTSGTITPRGESPAKINFLRTIDKTVEFDFNDGDKGLNTIVPGIPQIFRPHSDNTFEKGSSWLLAIIDVIAKNTQDRTQKVTIKSSQSLGYLNELFIHAILQKMDFSDIRWVIEEPSTKQIDESARVFCHLLNGSMEYGAPTCTVYKHGDTSVTYDFEIDTVTPKISVMKKPVELRTQEYSLWKKYTL